MLIILKEEGLPCVVWSHQCGSFFFYRSAFNRLSLPVVMVNSHWLCSQGWSKGVVFINGKNLGRYWSIGPQQTLYVPGPWLHRGDNQVEYFQQIYTCSFSSLTFSIDDINILRTLYRETCFARMYSVLYICDFKVPMK